MLKLVILLTFALTTSACSSGGWRPGYPTGPSSSSNMPSPTPPKDKPPTPPNAVVVQYEPDLSDSDVIGLKNVNEQWVSTAAYDFDKGTAQTGSLKYIFAIQKPLAQNRVYGFAIAGDATSTAQHACSSAGRPGDLVQDNRVGHSGTMCVPIGMALRVLSADGQILYQRTSANPMPPPSYGLEMPDEHSYALPAGAREVQAVLDVQGSVSFNVEHLQLYIDETTLK